MFELKLLEMTDHEIDDLCEVIKYLARPSHWKILRTLLKKQRDCIGSFVTRKELLDVTGLTNVTKDMNFLIENNIIQAQRTYRIEYYLNPDKAYDKMTQNALDLILEYKNKRDYRC